MSQGVLCQKIRFLCQKLWPVACEHTDTHTQGVLAKCDNVWAGGKGEEIPPKSCDIIWTLPYQIIEKWLKSLNNNVEPWVQEAPRLEPTT